MPSAKKTRDKNRKYYQKNKQRLKAASKAHSKTCYSNDPEKKKTASKVRYSLDPEKKKAASKARSKARYSLDPSKN